MILMVGQETHGQEFIYVIKSLIFQQKMTSMIGIILGLQVVFV